MVMRVPTVFAALLRGAARAIFYSDFLIPLLYPTIQAGVRFTGTGTCFSPFGGRFPDWECRNEAQALACRIENLQLSLYEAQSDPVAE
jgi:hypothetical protein